MRPGSGFRACVFGAFFREVQGRIPGLSSPPCHQSGYSPSPKVTVNSIIDGNNLAVSQLSREEREGAIGVKSIWMMMTAPDASSCPAGGLLGAGCRQFPAILFAPRAAGLNGAACQRRA
jgi:hypothetical protein